MKKIKPISKYTQLKEVTDFELLCSDIDNLVESNKLDKAQSLINSYALSYKTYSSYSNKNFNKKTSELFKESEMIELKEKNITNIKQFRRVNMINSCGMAILSSLYYASTSSPKEISITVLYSLGFFMFTYSIMYIIFTFGTKSDIKNSLHTIKELKDLNVINHKDK